MSTIPRAFRHLATAALALVLAAGILPAALAEAPAASGTIPSVYLAAGTSFYGALDLANFFSISAGHGLTFTAAPFESPPSTAAEAIHVSVRGTLLDIKTPSGNWSGRAPFQVKACDAGAPESCALSNPFDIIVGGAPPRVGPAPAPPVYSISGLPSDGGVAAGTQLTVSAEGGQTGPPPMFVWFLDGQAFAEGAAAVVPPLPAGEHVLEVRDAGAGDVVLVRTQVRSGPTLPPAAAPGTGSLSTMSAAAAAVVLLAAFGSARLRSPVLWFALGVVGGRSPRDAPLDHFTRGSLYQLIKDEPGIHFSELRRRTGTSVGSCMHHLKVLEDAAYVRSRPIGAKTHYYSTDRVPQQDTFGLTETDEMVLTLVHGSPGISLADLAARIGKSRGTVSRSVSRLALLGHVTTGRVHRQRTVFPREGRTLPNRLRPSGPISTPEGGTVP